MERIRQNQHKGSKQVLLFKQGRGAREEEERHSQFLEKFVVLTKTKMENAKITT